MSRVTSSEPTDHSPAVSPVLHRRNETRENATRHPGRHATPCRQSHSGQSHHRQSGQFLTSNYLANPCSGKPHPADASGQRPKQNNFSPCGQFRITPMVIAAMHSVNPSRQPNRQITRINSRDGKAITHVDHPLGVCNYHPTVDPPTHQDKSHITILKRLSASSDIYLMSILRHNAEPSTAISLSTGSLFQWRGNPQVKFPGGRSRRRPTRKDNLIWHQEIRRDRERKRLVEWFLPTIENFDLRKCIITTV